MTDDSSSGASRGLEVAVWRKSTFSSGGECVVVADLGGGEVAVRNSNAPDAGTLVLDRMGLAGWVAGCKAGEFDA